MADKQAYRDWETMAVKARQLAADRSLPLWQKAHLISGAYAGLEINQLRSKHRHKILNLLGQINVILKRYELATFDDYQHIDEADLRLIVQLAKDLAPN